MTVTACDRTTIGGPTPTSTEVATSATAPPRPLDDGPLTTSDLSPSPSASGSSDVRSPPPEPLEAAQPVTDETLANRPRPGVRLTMRYRYPEAATPPSLTEVELPRIQRQAKTWLPTMTVGLMEGRMHMALAGAHAVPPGTRLVARRDRFGHLLLWPDGKRYRVVPPGALRALFADGRADVGPVTTPPAKILPPGEMFGRDTTRVAIDSVLGEVELELVAEPAVGSAAGLLCRALLDLGGVSPGHEVCTRALVAVAATYRWSEGGGVRLEATAFELRDDLDPQAFAAPPARARFDPTGMPPPPGQIVPDEELATWRSKVIDVGPRPDDAPASGLLAVNRSDRWRWLVLDGVPVARVDPWSEVRLGGLVPGRYNVRWRGFLGQEPTKTKEITTPFRIVDGDPSPDPSDTSPGDVPAGADG